MKHKKRLDRLMVDTSLVKSRERAKALIMEGKVFVDGACITKAGTLVSTDAHITVTEDDVPYVSRGGMKLDAALDFFSIDPNGKIIMDIGCSTGGFTDCVLKRGAQKVYAIDVGYGQFDWSLRNNAKIVLLERTNIRYLEKKHIEDTIDIILIDVSFISLLKILPKTLDFLKDSGEVLALIKPQFEVGKGLVDRGGVVKDESKRITAIEHVRCGAEKLGFDVIGVFESPIHGQKGNREYFISLKRSRTD